MNLSVAKLFMLGLLNAAVGVQAASEPAGQLPPPTTVKAADVRAKAKEILGILPDKVPGAEKDTPALVELGRKLYFDKRLSANQSQSCNSCHVVDKSGPG